MADQERPGAAPDPASLPCPALPCFPAHCLPLVRRAGRITLLLGPPSGGKSVLLQALSGRLRPGRKLRVRLRWGGWARATGAVGPQPAITLAGVLSRSMPPQLCALTPLQIRGSIKYNGIPLDEFQPRRTAGLVQQEDNHIAGRRIPGDGVGVVAACVWVWVCVGGVVCGFVCGWVGCVCVGGGGTLGSQRSGRKQGLALWRLSWCSRRTSAPHVGGCAQLGVHSLAVGCQPAASPPSLQAPTHLPLPLLLVQT